MKKRQNFLDWKIKHFTFPEFLVGKYSQYNKWSQGKKAIKNIDVKKRRKKKKEY